MRRNKESQFSAAASNSKKKREHVGNCLLMPEAIQNLRAFHIFGEASFVSLNLNFFVHVGQ